MGQIATIELAQQTDNEEICDDLMTKVLSFASETEAVRFAMEFSNDQCKQLWYEIQILSIQKLFSGVQRQWKVVVSIEYPQRSLRSVIIQNRKNKEGAVYYELRKLLLILQLTAQFILIFSSSMCQHLDIYAYIFQNDQKIKICNPKLLYQTCSRPDCRRNIDKAVILRQIIEVVLMEKVFEINKWRTMRRVHEIYGNEMFDNLIGNLLKEESDLKVILSDYLQMKEQSKNTKNYLIYYHQNPVPQGLTQEYPKTPYFPTTQFVAFPKEEKIEQVSSGLKRYQKAISESIVREDSLRQYQIERQQEQFHYLSIQKPQYLSQM